MSRRPSLVILIALCGLLVTVLPAFAAEDVYSERTFEIAKKLNCPVCHGQTVAASQSRLANEMRSTIESQVQAGKSDREIIDFFIARFGEEVLAEPPNSGLNLALWWIPVGMLGLGAIAIVLYTRESVGLRRSHVADEDQLDAELEEIARDALGDGASSTGRLAADRGTE